MKKKIVNILILALVSVFSLAIGASAATTITSSSVSYGDITVKAALDELITKTQNSDNIITCTPGHYCTKSTSCPSGALCTKVKLGDYVSMIPTQTQYKISSGLTGYTSEQTINPSELNLWRVIDIRADGTIEIVSEYVSSTDIYFSGLTGYVNFVGALNLVAKHYENINYTVGSRYIGFNSQTQVIEDTSKFTTTPPWTSTTDDHGNSYETLGGGDIMYTYDTNTSTGLVYKALGTLIANKVGTTTATNYWLNSRHYHYPTTTTSYWNGRTISSAGKITNKNIYRYVSSGWKDNPLAYALRPIVTLRSDITSFTGSGTSASPWVLS